MKTIHKVKDLSILVDDIQLITDIREKDKNYLHNLNYLHNFFSIALRGCHEWIHFKYGDNLEECKTDWEKLYQIWTGVEK